MVFYDDCKIAKSYAIKFKHSVKITYSKTPFFESSRGVARIFEWGARAPKAQEARRRRCRGGRVRGGGVPLPAGEGVWGGGCDPSPEKFRLFNLEMVYFGAHLRYSDALILKFCMTQCKKTSLNLYSVTETPLQCPRTSSVHVSY